MKLLNHILILLFGFNPFIKSDTAIKPTGIARTLCPKTFDRTFIWDKKRFKNIQYID